MDRFKGLLLEEKAGAGFGAPRRPGRLEREAEGVRAWIASGEGAFVPEYRPLRELYGAIRDRVLSGRDLRDLSADLLRRMPGLLYAGLGETELAEDEGFRRLFLAWLEGLPAGEAAGALRALWRQLLLKGGRERPGMGFWARALASAVPDGAPDDLRDARKALERFRILDGGGGSASPAVLGSVRERALSGDGRAFAGAGGGGGISLADRGFLAKFRLLANMLPAAGGGAPPEAAADGMASLLEEEGRLLRLIADDPDRGFEILGAAVRALEVCPGGASRRILPAVVRIFSRPDDRPSCFWLGEGEKFAAAFRRLSGGEAPGPAAPSPERPPGGAAAGHAAPSPERPPGGAAGPGGAVPPPEAEAAEALGIFFGQAPEGLGRGDPFGRASFWGRLVRQGAVVGTWTALGRESDDPSGCAPSPAGTGSLRPQAPAGGPSAPAGGQRRCRLSDGPPGISVLFLEFRRIIVGEWSDGSTFAWPHEDPGAPGLRLAEYSYPELLKRRNYLEIAPGYCWRLQIGRLLERFGVPVEPHTERGRRPSGPPGEA
jgi:hypothetical protein